jgi:glucosylglycerate phosphorylase
MTQARSREVIATRLYDKLAALYGVAQADALYQRLSALLDTVRGTESPVPRDALAVSERDVMLITYGDHVRRDGEKPLFTLWDTLNRLRLPINSIHMLPFYPYTSDDGFSVVNYFQVDPALGSWDNVRRLSADYRLMFDAVFNHISAQSAWFQAFLRGEAPYTDYFIALDPDTDVSTVTRPRTYPLLTPFETASGIQHVWTTFSGDQIDLNAANPDVLLEIIRALLFYVEQGAQFIRLDAIAFLWKQIGTTCIHLPQTHTIIQLLRDVLDFAAPDTILITETNVPHEENLSYFGDGHNEAQMVYQFALPPLILHTLRTGNAAALTAWAKTIQPVSDSTTFFNFTASHDGIGLRPVQGILADDDIEALVQMTLAQGGHVSYRSNSDGSQSSYELNITYFDAITAPEVTASQPETAVQRFMISQAIMLSMIGVPGIYFHSLLGSRNDLQGVANTGRSRSINREKLNADMLLREVENPASLRRAVLDRYRHLLEVRTAEAAFHPLGAQTVLDLHRGVFAVERVSPDGAARVLALHNISAQGLTFNLPGLCDGVNLLNRQPIDRVSTITLAPYQIVWLKLN